MTSEIASSSTFERLLAHLRDQDPASRHDIASEPLYQDFLRRFPADRLRQLTLDEYCVGKGAGSSFCWWIEHGLKPLMGRYLPGTARGHVLYFLENGSVYKQMPLRDLDDAAALAYTLRLQACIAEADMADNLAWIDDDTLLFHRAGVPARVAMGFGRRLRLLACYHPEESLPCASSEHLGHFLKVLGCPPAELPPERKPVARMLRLREFFHTARESVPGLSTRDFMEALYGDALGLAPKKEKDVPDDREPEPGARSAPAAQVVAQAGVPLNQILYGPPGTGKTFATIDAALEILDPQHLVTHGLDRPELKRRFDELAAEGRVRFVTFHQSFSYEDFVEGIRATPVEEAEVDADGATDSAAPTSAAEGLRYRVEPGVFLELCRDARRDRVRVEEPLRVRDGAVVWKLSIGEASGSDETRRTCFARDEARIGWNNVPDVRTVDLADSQWRLGPKDQASLEHFAEGMQKGDVVLCLASRTSVCAVGVVAGDYAYAPDVPDGVRPDYPHSRPVRWLATGLDFPVQDLNGGKTLALQTVYPLRRLEWPAVQHALAHAGVPLKPLVTGRIGGLDPYVLIIDEINRGSVSRIFGELITLIEVSKRDGADEQLSVVLPYSRARFSVPRNVHLVGTMNTADRSLANLDVALRRRFVFREMPPRPGLLQGVRVGRIDVAQLLTTLNERITVLLGPEHNLGHAYFMRLREAPTLPVLADIFRDQVLPLLQEYFFDDGQRVQWVLNDHRKPEAFRFLQARTPNLAALFGEDVNLERSAQVWRLNPEAFLSEQSYLGVLDHTLAAV